jgi:hypothetical protein
MLTRVYRTTDPTVNVLDLSILCMLWPERVRLEALPGHVNLSDFGASDRPLEGRPVESHVSHHATESERNNEDWCRLVCASPRKSGSPVSARLGDKGLIPLAAFTLGAPCWLALTPPECPDHQAADRDEENRQEPFVKGTLEGPPRLLRRGNFLERLAAHRNIWALCGVAA